MALVVMKFGGTSVGNVERIQGVARQCVERRRAGDQVVVVVSAMSGETNRLIALANKVSARPLPREMDVVMATGEQAAIGLTAMAISDLGVPAKSFCGHQVLIRTDSAHTKARIQSIDRDAVMRVVEAGGIPVIAGFQGVDAHGDFTTLGRGGSDTTAVAVAAALSADLCEIYTDVDGVFTTDPNICERARLIGKISYEEMLEFASLGAKVLQTRSVEFAMKYNVKTVVLNTFNPDAKGTVVSAEDKDMESVAVAGIAYNRDEARIAVKNILDRPGVASMIFGPLSEENISVDMIIQNVGNDGRTDLSFTVTKADFRRAIEIVRATLAQVGGSTVEGDDNIAKVSVIGVGMRSHAGVAAKMFQTLSESGINIMMISTSEIKVSCVIESKYTELAVRVLHDAFQLERAPKDRDPFPKAAESRSAVFTKLGETSG